LLLQMSRQSKMSSSYSKTAYFSGSSIVVPNGSNIALNSIGGEPDIPPVDVIVATSTANQEQIYNGDPTEANWGVWEVQADEPTRSNLVFYNLPEKTAPNNPLIPLDDVEQYYYIDRLVTISPQLQLNLPADTLISGQSPLVHTVTDYEDATFDTAIPKAGVNFGTDYNTNIIQATYNALDAGGVLRGYMKFYARPFTFTSSKWFNSVANPGTDLAGQPGPTFNPLNQVLPYASYAPTAIGLLITPTFGGNTGVTSGQVAEITIGPISGAPFSAPSHTYFQPNDVLEITTGTLAYPSGWFLYLANIQSVDGAGNSTWAAFTQDPSGIPGANIGVAINSAPVDLATVTFTIQRVGLGLGTGTGAVPTTMPVLSTVFNLDGDTDTILMTGGPNTLQENAIDIIDDVNDTLTMNDTWAAAQTALDLEPDVGVDFTYSGTIPRSIWISPSIGPVGTSQEPELDGNLSELFRTRQVYVPPPP
jgi:hypothetical protein